MVIIKNPELRYRKEEFGGIAKIKFKTFLLNKDQYRIIDNLENLDHETLTDKDKLIINKLVKDNLLIKDPTISN